MNKELAKSIGRAARQARKALQLTQEDTAELIKVSVEFYARLERGTSLPSILTFVRIVAALGVSADALIGRQPVDQVSSSEVPWQPPPLPESPEMRRLLRRLRKATPATVRLVNLFLREMERAPANSDQTPDDEDSDEELALEGMEERAQDPQPRVAAMDED